MKSLAIVLLIAALGVGIYLASQEGVFDDGGGAGRHDSSDRGPAPDVVAWQVIVDAVDSRNDDLRAETLEVMADLRDPRVAKYRARCLERDDAAIVRLRAAGLTALAGRKDLVPLVKAVAAEEDDYDAYIEAARAYGRIGTPECIPELVAILTAKDDIESDEDSMPHAAAWLGRMGARDQIPLLRSLLDAEDEEVVFGVACGLLLLGETDVLPRLLKGIEDDSELIVPFLAWPGVDIGVPVLTATMASDEPFESERGDAATALATIGTDAARVALEAAWNAVEALPEADRKDQAEFTGYVAAALARLGDDRGLEQLAAAATGPDEPLAIEALRGVTRLGRGLSVQTLLEVIEHPGYKPRTGPVAVTNANRWVRRDPGERPTHLRRLVWLWAARALLAVKAG